MSWLLGGVDIVYPAILALSLVCQQGFFCQQVFSTILILTSGVQFQILWSSMNRSSIVLKAATIFILNLLCGIILLNLLVNIIRVFVH